MAVYNLNAANRSSIPTVATLSAKTSELSPLIICSSISLGTRQLRAESSFNNQVSKQDIHSHSQLMEIDNRSPPHK
jgi:hypothetical protein